MRRSSREWYDRARLAEKNNDLKLAAVAYLHLAKSFIKKKRYADALHVCTRVRKLGNDSFRLLVLSAVAERATGDEKRARMTVRKVAQRLLKATKRRGLEHYVETKWKGHSDLRQLLYEQILEWERTTALPFISLAKVRSERGDTDGALRNLMEALRTRTHDAETISALHKLLIKLNRQEEDIHLQRFKEGKLQREDLILLLFGGALAAQPVSDGNLPQEESLGAIVKRLEAELGVKSDDGNETVAPLVKEFRERADEILGSEGASRYDMAMAFLEMGLMNDARSEVSKVGRSDPFYVRGQFLAAESFLREESFLSALEVYQRVLRESELQPMERTEANYRLAEIYLKLGDLGQAISLLNEVESHVPQYRDLAGLRREIQRLAETKSPVERSRKTG